MAHFAHIENGKVTFCQPWNIAVIVVSNDDCGGGIFPESEILGQKFISSLGIPGTWKQTSYNNNFRNKYAGEGYLYLENEDIFVEPSPYPSWILNSSHEWIAPVAMPSVGGPYLWDENTISWKQAPKDKNIGDTHFAELE